MAVVEIETEPLTTARRISAKYPIKGSARGIFPGRSSFYNGYFLTLILNLISANSVIPELFLEVRFSRRLI
jgi:hypothetical protein